MKNRLVSTEIMDGVYRLGDGESLYQYVSDDR